MSHFSQIESQSPPSGAFLLYGGTVLTMDPEARIIRDAEVLIDHGRIAAIGRAITISPGTRPLDVQGNLILPGLVQGHVHLGQTFFRGMGEGRRLLPWLQDRIWPLEAAHDDESAYWCTLLGAAECLLGGTTTIQDMGLGPGARGLLLALRDARLRAFAGKCLMDSCEGMPEGLLESTAEALRSTEALGEEFGSSDDRLRYSLNPRFILSCSDELWRGVAELAESHSWPIHTHALEQAEETAQVKALKDGCDEIEHFEKLGILDADLRIAHGVQLEERHYSELAQKRFSVVHCPSSNLKLGSGIADIVSMRRAGIPVGVGCDGAACSNHFDALEELRLAALLQKQKHAPDAFSGVEALRLATSEGAQALGIHEETGSLEAGQRADITVLQVDRPEMWAAPNVDLHDLVAFSASRAQVRHVFVGGDQLVADGELTHLDLATIRREATRTCKALLERAGLDL